MLYYHNKLQMAQCYKRTTKNNLIRTTLLVESFVGTNFCNFANFLVVRESLYRQNHSVEAIRESLYLPNFGNFWNWFLWFILTFMTHLLALYIKAYQKHAFVINMFYIRKFCFYFFCLVYHRWERIFCFCHDREPNLKFELADKILKISYSWNFISAKFFWFTIRERQFCNLAIRKCLYPRKYVSAKLSTNKVYVR